MRDRFDVAFANDTDARPPRHRDAARRPDESRTIISPPRSPICSRTARTGARTRRSARPWCRARIIDRVAAELGRKLVEVPVGFKWFVDGLLTARSASAARRAQAPRSCAATARCGPPTRTASSSACSRPRSWRRPAAIPSQLFDDLTARVRRAALRAHRRRRHHAAEEHPGKLSPEQLGRKELAGDPVRAMLSKAPGNGQPFGGIKVDTDIGWFAARPSGTEDSTRSTRRVFASTEHLKADSGRGPGRAGEGVRGVGRRAKAPLPLLLQREGFAASTVSSPAKAGDPVRRGRVV